MPNEGTSSDDNSTKSDASDSDNNVAQKVVLELYPVSESGKKSGKIFKKIQMNSALHALSTKYIITDAARTKIRADKAEREIRQEKKKTLKLKQEAKSKEKKKDKLKEKQRSNFKQYFNDPSRSSSKPSSSQQGSRGNLKSGKNSTTNRTATKKSKDNKLPSTPESATSTPTTTSTNWKGQTTGSEFSTEDEVDSIDDNSFDCLDLTGSITVTSFVAHKHSSVYSTCISNRKTSKTEYLIGQVQTIVDNKSFRVKYFTEVKYKNYLPYYIPDTSRQQKTVKNKQELVLLKDPRYSKEPKVLKQNARSTDTDLIHKWFFPRCIEDTIRSHFEGQ